MFREHGKWKPVLKKDGRNPGAVKPRQSGCLGLSAGQVAQTVDMAIDGQVATRYRVGGDEVDIIVQLEEGQRQNLTDIKGIRLASPPLGFQVSLDDVAELVLEQGPSSIYRENQTRVATVSADIIGRPLGKVSNDIARALAVAPPFLRVTRWNLAARIR